VIGTFALALAWALDAAFGEPRSAWHPVAWFGRAVAPAGRWAATLAPWPGFVAGALLWSLAVGGVAAIAWGLQRAVGGLPSWAAVPLLALALKPTFAWRMLKDEVRAVDEALAGSLDAGRARLSRLCSRDVSQLDAVAVRETALESLAENFNDSLVAPLFWFLVAGLPGAWAWRAANTLDAMWGYRGRWEWAGKCAARADDVLAWLPARLAAALLWRPALGWVRLRDEARRTPSPNGGWPMAALALRLDVRLEKPGVYTLHATGRDADAGALARGLRVVERAARVAFVVALVVVLGVHAPWR
jgi:adenosylcobinamide-phosphate synthase